jgi:hypothetical protein
MEGGSRGTNLIHIEKLQRFVSQIGLICKKSSRKELKSVT